MNQGTDKEKRHSDSSGRDRIAHNVIFSWGAYFVFIVTGFIMPRIIDAKVGQVGLGIWDFCWSMVNYLSLAGLGVGSSVNRHVAKYRTSGEIDKLRFTVSSVAYIQFTTAFLVALAVIAFYLLLPRYFGERLGSDLQTAQWVVFFLGTSLALQMANDTSRGVITGCHRWDLHNTIHAGSRALFTGLMITALMCGGGLKQVSTLYFSTVAVTEVIRWIASRRVCPEMRVRLRYVKRKYAQEMLLFGLKTIVAGLPPLILIQTCSLLIVNQLGPAMLALLARPVMLVRHVETFVNKFAYILTPTAGSMSAGGNTAEIKDLVIGTSRWTIAITLPILMLLMIYGDLILELWMGDHYAVGPIIVILSLGYLLPVSQNSTLRILVGLNMHGRIGAFVLCLTIVLLGIGAAIIHAAGWSLNRAALLIAVTFTLSSGLCVTVFTCRKLGISLALYAYRSFVQVGLMTVPYGACLVAMRFLLQHYHPVIALFGGAIPSFLCLMIVYWKTLLTAGQRQRIISRFFPQHKHSVCSEVEAR